MTNKEISATLYEIADLLEIDGVQFKPRAYRRAAQTIESISEELSDLYKKCGRKCIDDIPSIGASISESIEEMVKTDGLKYLDLLHKKIPAAVHEISRIEGVGPKTVGKLYKKIKIKSVADLEKAARSGKIAKLAGFGKKSEDKILRGIEFLRASKGRFLLGDALPIAEKILTALRSVKEIKKCEVVGSIRRRRETIGDIDIICVTSNPKAALKAFSKLPNVKSIKEFGERDASVALKDGLDSDLMIIPEEDFGSAMVHFTGSKYHNIELRQIAIKKGMKLSEYGLFKGKKRIVSKTETEVYRALGLPFIEPELREARGEIMAGKNNSLPRLIQYNSIKGDLQTQTNWTDGANTIEEMALAAKALGLSYIAITDHTKSLAITGGLDERELARQAREIDRVNKKIKNFRVLKGAEVNILKDGKLDIDDVALRDLDVVGIAVHSHFNLSEAEMTERVIRAMKNKNVHILFHPTGRLINERPAYKIDMQKIIRAAKQFNVALEINSYPNRLDLSDAHIKMAVDAKVKLVIDTDAHNKNHFQFLNLGVSQARRGWARASDVLNTKPVGEFLKAIKKII